MRDWERKTDRGGSLARSLWLCVTGLGIGDEREIKVMMKMNHFSGDLTGDLGEEDVFF